MQAQRRPQAGAARATAASLRVVDLLEELERKRSGGPALAFRALLQSSLHLCRHLHREDLHELRVGDAVMAIPVGCNLDGLSRVRGGNAIETGDETAIPAELLRRR